MPPRKQKVDAIDNQPTKKIKLDDDQQIEKQIVKGKAAVDKEVPNSANYRVLQINGQTFDATMNQSNVGQNNNKFYRCQVLQLESNPNQYYLFTRWGRVGVKGQQILDICSSQQQSITAYNSKVNSKQKGGYTLLEINYGNEEEEQKEKKVKKNFKSKLDQSLYDLMSFIFDQNLLDQAMKEIGYDAKKMPLGKLGESTINEAYKILNDLLQEIGKKKLNQDVINDLNNKFYSLIPHNVGFSQMSNFILKTPEQIKDKLDMMQSLVDMKLTTKILKEQAKDDINEFDDKYKKLNCKLVPLDIKSKDYQLVEKFMKATLEKQTWGVFQNEKIVQVFKVDRNGEEKKFKKQLGNIQLLWHGSRVQNFGGILSQGLRIAPPEAPHNGYAYGKGIYLANHYTTSQGYSCPTNGERLILLCRSSLGKVGQYQGMNKYLLDGFNSAIGFASKELPANAYDDFNGMKVPCNENQYGNAYIVYDLDQVKMEYLIRIKI